MASPSKDRIGTAATYCFKSDTNKSLFGEGVGSETSAVSASFSVDPPAGNDSSLEEWCLEVDGWEFIFLGDAMARENMVRRKNRDIFGGGEKKQGCLVRWI